MIVGTQDDSLEIRNFHFDILARSSFRQPAEPQGSTPHATSATPRLVVSQDAPQDSFSIT